MGGWETYVEKVEAVDVAHGALDDWVDLLVDDEPLVIVLID